MTNYKNTEHEDMELADEAWMGEAIKLAHLAAEADEIPVGAVLVVDGQCVGRGYNQVRSQSDPSAHAEVVALRDAGFAINNYRLTGSTLYVTIEPCTMCFGALVHARVSRIVYGASEPRAGVLGSQLSLQDEAFYNHKISCTGGVLASTCGELITSFLKARRK